MFEFLCRLSIPIEMILIFLFKNCHSKDILGSQLVLPMTFYFLNETSLGFSSSLLKPKNSYVLEVIDYILCFETTEERVTVPFL